MNVNTEMQLTSAVTADSTGAERRRADYILTAYLAHVEHAGEATLDADIKQLHLHLAENGGDSPLYFGADGANGPNSEQLNNAVDRCLHFDRIDFDRTDGYTVTAAGEAYLEQDATLARHGITSEFRAAVTEALQHVTSTHS